MNVQNGSIKQKPSVCVSVLVGRFIVQVTWFLFGSSRKVTFIETGDKDKVTSKLELLTDKMRSQHNRLTTHCITRYNRYLFCALRKQQMNTHEYKAMEEQSTGEYVYMCLHSYNVYRCYSQAT